MHQSQGEEVKQSSSMATTMILPSDREMSRFIQETKEMVPHEVVLLHTVLLPKMSISTRYKNGHPLGFGRCIRNSSLLPSWQPH